MKPAIAVTGLSKRYTIAHEVRARHDTLTGLLAARLRALARGELPVLRRETHEDFWALREIDFSVERGERLGIVGRNGAGKSTLLKILSRITEPTAGRIELRGRMSSLLEVGTGFHPELTGRENIFLNGAILGMPAAEIRRKFDEIVAFAEVERFLDTPVKRYSSGMYVRLAFSVAAHLEPEILVVDEVLAVGDASFQEKCIARMQDTAASGRTVLFVSHAMAAVRKLCTRALYLDRGRVMAFGSTDAVIEQYLAANRTANEGQSERVFPDQPDKDALIRRVALLDDAGRPTREYGMSQQVWLEIEYELKRDVRNCMIIFAVSRDGVLIYQSHDTDLEPCLLQSRARGTYRARVPLPRRLLTAGRYWIYAVLALGSSGEYGHDGKPDVLDFVVTEDDEADVVTHKGYASTRGALIVVEPRWSTSRLDRPGTPKAGRPTVAERGERHA